MHPLGIKMVFMIALEPTWLTRQQTVLALGIGVHALQQWVEDGYLPPPARQGRGGGRPAVR